MKAIRPGADIQPLSLFRSQVARFVEQVRSTRRPLVLTHHGRGTAVLVGVEEYETLLDEIETLRDIRAGEAQADTGEVVPHGRVKREVMGRLRG